MFLNCHSYFSFKYGTLSPQALFDEARRNGVQKLVLTDINSTAGHIEMMRICRERQQHYPLELALGIEFRQNHHLLYIGIARNNQGYQELNQYLSHHNRQSLPLLSRAPFFENVFIIYPWGQATEDLREHEFIGVRNRHLNKVITSRHARNHSHLVVWHPVTFKDKSTYHVHRLLRAIDLNTILSKLSPQQQANPGEIMLPAGQLKQQFQRFPQVIANTEKLLSQCSIEFEFGTDKNKSVVTGSRQQDLQKLEALALDGFASRFCHKPYQKKAFQRLRREMEIIGERNFAAYFLISHDIVSFASQQQFEHVGRGSGANSLVAYCLRLTNVDPIELDLYFERFLNPQRSSPPDFDIDFSWRDRDAVTQYIFDSYGYQHTALLGTHNTFKERSIVRELGKVFGLPKNEIDQLVSYPQQQKDQVTSLIFRYVKKMLSIPSHLSVHAGGVLITEKPIHAYTATDFPPKGYPTTHFEMHNAEDIGIYKFDILSQRGLGHIKDSIKLVSENQHQELDINDFESFKKDPAIKKMLSAGRTMGCFYVESPATRMLLGKLSCDNYLTLVAASSIIRPGVARSGMMRAYIERHHQVQNGGSYQSIHPKMDELMAETYGVMVYQEDVIKVAHHFAGLSLAEADILRRGMSGKFRSREEFKRVEVQFFENCRKRGYPDKVSQRVWFEIESFAGYSFSKGHSASYAVESYQSLYLKAHYPLEFMVGVINNFGGFYRTEFYFHEARMSGATIEAPCVNHSKYLTGIKGTTIYMGLIHLRSLESKLAQSVEWERGERGAYTSLDNFLRRVPIGLEQLRILVRIDAFRFTGKDKRSLLWEAHRYFNQPLRIRTTLDLFNITPKSYTLPPLENYPYANAFDQIELLGFPLCAPFDMLATEDMGNTLSHQLRQKVNKMVSLVGYLVTIKNTHTKNHKLMHFGTFYDREGLVFDTTHFPPSAHKFPFKGKGFYRMKGKVVTDFGYPMVEVGFMEKIPMVDKFAVGESKKDRTHLILSN
jgi:DNA polymerase-3 subunit alpha